jgi:bacterioferritin-associated ferredoxin
VYVCLCRVVTDRDVIAAIEALSTADAVPDRVKAVARECGAGGRCGGCLASVARLVEEHLAAGV